MEQKPPNDVGKESRATNITWRSFAFHAELVAKGFKFTSEVGCEWCDVVQAITTEERLQKESKKWICGSPRFICCHAGFWLEVLDSLGFQAMVLKNKDPLFQIISYYQRVLNQTAAKG